MPSCPPDIAFVAMLGPGLEPEQEHRFAAPRRWRFDYAWPAVKLALEVEGGGYGVGRPCPACGQRRRVGHQAAGRWAGDMEKYNTAVTMGWRVLRCRPQDLATAATVEAVRALI